jgi:hypothetical protein
LELCFREQLIRLVLPHQRLKFMALEKHEASLLASQSDYESFQIILNVFKTNLYVNTVKQNNDLFSIINETKLMP